MRRIFLLLIVGFALAGCVTNTKQTITSLNRVETRQPAIVLMPFDMQLSLLSAGGVPEPRADWTEAAEKHLLEAIRSERQAKNVRLTVFEDKQTNQEEEQLVFQLQKLHGVVGQQILIHQYTNPQMQLPSKEGRFDWSLGPAAKALKEKTQSDYALFVWVRDSYTSGGRVAVILLAAALGVAVPGGQQVGFASLVDLENGNVVWFNLLARGNGDLRSPEGAADTARVLLSQLPQ